MRRSTVLSLPPQLVFPGKGNVSFVKISAVLISGKRAYFDVRPELRVRLHQPDFAEKRREEVSF
jgi:hypothetical protein